MVVSAYFISLIFINEQPEIVKLRNFKKRVLVISGFVIIGILVTLSAILCKFCEDIFYLEIASKCQFTIKMSTRQLQTNKYLIYLKLWKIMICCVASVWAARHIGRID